MASWINDSSPTSPAKYKGRCPISAISAAKSFKSPRLRAMRLSWKLCFANSKAKARPMPLEAPVMMAVG